MPQHDQLVHLELGASAPPAAGFVIVLATTGRRVVVVRHRERDRWELPGGLIAGGESPHRAAARELYEETGIESPPVSSLGWVVLRCAPDWRERPGLLFAAPLPTDSPARRSGPGPLATGPLSFRPRSPEVTAVRYFDEVDASDVDAAAQEIIARLVATRPASDSLPHP